MNIPAALRRRQLGFRGTIDIDFAIDQIRLKEAIRLPNILPNNDEFGGELSSKTCGPLCCTNFSEDKYAVANEDGFVNIIKTRKLEHVTRWMAHDNAIFDIKSCPGGTSIFTASGDSSIIQWDLNQKKDIIQLSPHQSSIKSLSVYDSNTLASGSRDGTIKVHDLRKKDATVLTIKDAHRNHIISKPRRTPAKTDPISCVTNVVFDDLFPRIYSAGANDATIKLWDLRKIRVKRTFDGQNLVSEPSNQVHHPSRGVHCGYSDLLLSSGRLYAACSDNKIYCYEKFSSDARPIRFTGFKYDTYLKLAIMDDRFLFSGSKGGGALVWNLGTKQSSKYYPETTKQIIGQLKPDNAETYDTNVTGTDWSSLSVFSFRDDGLVCKWSMQGVTEQDRKRLQVEGLLKSIDDEVTIQMSDIIDVNVLRPSQGLRNSQSLIPGT